MAAEDSSDSDSSEGSNTNENVDGTNEVPDRRYPLRERIPRQLEGYIPWDVIDHRL